MTKYHLHRATFSLLIVLFFITYNKGPDKTYLLNTSSASYLAESKTLQVNDTTIAYGPSDIVQCALLDKAGNLWFGTSGGEGVFRYDGKSFTNLTEKDGLSNNEVGSIYEDKIGNIWFGTNDGICRYNGKTFSRLPIPIDSKYLRNVVTGILQDKTGNLWFGTLNQGVYRFDGKGFTNYLSSEVIKCISEDKAGNIWVGSWSNGGAYYYDVSRANHPCIKNSCKHDLKIPQDLKEHNEEIAGSPTGFTWQGGLSDGMIHCIFDDKNGNIWFGSRDKGLCRYDPSAEPGTSSGTFTYFSEKEGLCNNNVSCILQDKAGNFWFGSSVKYGSKAGGVCRFDEKSLPAGQARFTNFTPKEGLENNDIFCSVEDKAGNLWFGGRYGRLFRYDGISFADFSQEVHKK